MAALSLSLSFACLWIAAFATHNGVAGFQQVQRRTIGSYRNNNVAICPKIGSKVAARQFRLFYSSPLSHGSLYQAGSVCGRPALSMSEVFDDSPPPRSKGERVSISSASDVLTLYAPLWTIVSASFGFLFASQVGTTLGSLSAVRRSLFVLMLAMGLSVAPRDVSRAVMSPGLVGLNAACCFGVMPLLSILVGATIGCGAEQRAGTVLLGCVGGGQASNLFTLLAGGDVALSVVFTLSTTLLGVAATPALTKRLLGRTIRGGAQDVFVSVASLVLAPILAGLTIRRVLPGDFVERRVAPLCPAVGVVATLLLVAGGSSNSASSFFLGSGASGGVTRWASAAAASVALPVAGAAVALGLSSLLRLSEPAKRALVVEVLSKSPTVAYVLAREHFGPGAEVVPAAAMVSLAVVGAVVASAWTMLDRRKDDA